MNRTVISLRTMVACSAALVALHGHAGHVVTQTTLDGVPIKKTDTYANASGDLRMEERRYGSSATMSASGSGEAKVEYFETDVEDVTLFQSKTRSIVSLEGEDCMVLSPESEAPFGVGASLGGNREQMAQIMEQANAAIAEAMREAEKEGMTEEQRRAIESFTQPFLNAPSAPNKDALTAQPLNETRKVGAYKASGYRIVNGAGQEKHRVWMVPVRKVNGGKTVRNAMGGMIDAYSSYLGKFGGESLMDTELSAIIDSPQMKGLYPVRIEDLDTRHVTEVIEANGTAPTVDYYPACKPMSFFGN